MHEKIFAGSARSRPFPYVRVFLLYRYNFGDMNRHSAHEGERRVIENLAEEAGVSLSKSAIKLAISQCGASVLVAYEREYVLDCPWSAPANARLHDK